MVKLASPTLAVGLVFLALLVLVPDAASVKCLTTSKFQPSSGGKVATASEVAETIDSSVSCISYSFSGPFMYLGKAFGVTNGARV
jgi:hypothetical protein